MTIVGFLTLICITLIFILLKLNEIAGYLKAWEDVENYKERKHEKDKHREVRIVND